MSPLDLIRSRDGSMSQTKLAAASFHLLIFVTVAWVTWNERGFNKDMWEFYGLVAVGHALLDKTSATVASFKNKQLEVNADAQPSTTTTTITTSKEPL